MLFYRICSLRTDNWVNSTKLFLVFLVSVLAYLVFIHLTSIHRSLTLLVVFRIQYFTICTSSLPVFIHLPHSAPILLLPTHRLDYSFFTSFLLHAATSTYLPISEAASRAISLHFFHLSPTNCSPILQHMSSVFWGYLAQLFSIQFFRFLYLKYFWRNLIYFTI